MHDQTREHHVVGRPPDWSMTANSFQPATYNDTWRGNWRAPDPRRGHPTDLAEEGHRILGRVWLWALLIPAGFGLVWAASQCWLP